jgi:hypothetical protein
MPEKNTGREPVTPTKSVILISAALAAGLEVLSVAIGLVFMGTIGLQAGGSRMSVAWGIWLVCVFASLFCLVLAVRKGSLAALIGATLVPVPSSLLLAQVLLRVGA